MLFIKIEYFVQNQKTLSSKDNSPSTSVFLDIEHSIDIEIGSRIRQYRRGGKLSQKDLAEKLGMKYQVIQKYEKAANRISLSRLITIANILGVHPEIFLEGLPSWEGGHSNSSADFHSTNTAIDMSRALSKLPPPTQRAIINMVREISATYANMGQDRP